MLYLCWGRSGQGFNFFSLGLPQDRVSIFFSLGLPQDRVSFFLIGDNGDHRGGSFASWVFVSTLWLNVMVCFDALFVLGAAQDWSPIFFISDHLLAIPHRNDCPERA